MKKLRWMSAAAALLMFGACGDSGSGNNNDVLGSDTLGGTDTQVGVDVTPGISAVTGVNTAVNVTPATPISACNPSEVDTAIYGAQYPFGGYTHWDSAHTVFTCNQCPGGRAAIQGKFQLIGRTEPDTGGFDPDLPLATDYIESLYVDGNTFYQHIKDAKSGAEWEYRGYYVCTQSPENTKERLLWIPTEVVKAGPSDNPVVVGQASVSDGALSGQEVQGTIGTYWFDDGALTADKSVFFEYCRFGTEIDVDGTTKTCRDRFAE